MAITYFTVEENTAPAIEITLKRNGTAIDLTGSTIDLIIQNPKTKRVTNAGHQTCSIIDDDGIIGYEVQEGDLPNPNIDYLAEVKITYPDSTVERIYDILQISIRPKLG